MREHEQVRVVSGTRGPVLKSLHAALAHSFLGLGSILQLAAPRLHPGTEVLGVAFGQFGHGMAIPITEAAFTDATIIDGLDSTQYVGESLRGGVRTLQIGADNEPVVDFLPTIDVQPFQGRGGLLDLPFTHGVQRNVDLALELVSGVVGGASMTDKENGTNMIGHSDDPFGSSEETGKREGCLVPSMTFGNRQPDTRISANISVM